MPLTLARLSRIEKSMYQHTYAMTIVSPSTDTLSSECPIKSGQSLVGNLFYRTDIGCFHSARRGDRPVNNKPLSRKVLEGQNSSDGYGRMPRNLRHGSVET